ncbi:hypothetical protein EVB81_186 [Rhizobium phage RHph_I46]|uniref:Uncharacterized protein n=1 Tax=Rhizobium phage RHph_I1_9 TaxID=2509729 RepID=A0A7S5R9J5_9CAUD|nr:hypothetical protein PP936_gp185 [Rhizobium phage RHph_I1_9]QIG69755.1 hypothetical protein EVB81_186 [Rhizobium phage RHph_I46]QIG71036.1 hypothetical protein EVB92_186 [Rhizobium phage RHph_I9]QIG73622.1 hypothetical protein EVC04_185 [Rhizobium phage RHph_I1_9]QIG76375.1 hypothetical protein EVC25_186 [Rhizobium phage RHph_I34]
MFALMLVQYPSFNQGTPCRSIIAQSDDFEVLVQYIETDECKEAVKFQSFEEVLKPHAWDYVEFTPSN